jgi:hypothetical protein
MATKFFGAPSGCRPLHSGGEESDTWFGKFILAKESFESESSTAPTFDFEAVYNTASFNKAGFESETQQGKQNKILYI